jgi:hypothetical protein
MLTPPLSTIDTQLVSLGTIAHFFLFIPVALVFGDDRTLTYDHNINIINIVALTQMLSLHR